MGRGKKRGKMRTMAVPGKSPILDDSINRTQTPEFTKITPKGALQKQVRPSHDRKRGTPALCNNDKFVERPAGGIRATSGYQSRTALECLKKGDSMERSAGGPHGGALR